MDLEQLITAYEKEQDPELKAAKKAAALVALRPMIESRNNPQLMQAYQDTKRSAINNIHAAQGEAGSWWTGLKDAASNPLQTLSSIGSGGGTQPGLAERAGSGVDQLVHLPQQAVESALPPDATVEQLAKMRADGQRTGQYSDYTIGTARNAISKGAKFFAGIPPFALDVLKYGGQGVGLGGGGGPQGKPESWPEYAARGASNVMSAARPVVDLAQGLYQHDPAAMKQLVEHPEGVVAAGMIARGAVGKAAGLFRKPEAQPAGSSAVSGASLEGLKRAAAQTIASSISDPNDPRLAQVDAQLRSATTPDQVQAAIDAVKPRAEAAAAPGAGDVSISELGLKPAKVNSAPAPGSPTADLADMRRAMAAQRGDDSANWEGPDDVLRIDDTPEEEQPTLQPGQTLTSETPAERAARERAARIDRGRARAEGRFGPSLEAGQQLTGMVPDAERPDIQQLQRLQGTLGALSTQAATPIDVSPEESAARRQYVDLTRAAQDHPPGPGLDALNEARGRALKVLQDADARRQAVQQMVDRARSSRLPVPAPPTLAAGPPLRTDLPPPSFGAPPPMLPPGSGAVNLPPRWFVRQPPEALDKFNARNAPTPDQLSEMERAGRDARFLRAAPGAAGPARPPAGIRDPMAGRPTGAVSAALPSTEALQALASQRATERARAVMQPGQPAGAVADRIGQMAPRPAPATGPAPGLFRRLTPEPSVVEDFANRAKRMSEATLEATRQQLMQRTGQKKLFSTQADIEAADTQRAQLRAVEAELARRGIGTPKTEAPPAAKPAGRAPGLFRSKLSGLIADDEGSINWSAIGNAAQRGLGAAASLFRSAPDEAPTDEPQAPPSPGEAPERAPETERGGQAGDIKSRLADAMRERTGRLPDVSRLTEAEAKQMLENERRHYLMGSGQVDPMEGFRAPKPAEIPKTGIGPADLLAFDPAQPGNTMQDTALKLQNLEAGETQMGRQVRDFVVGDRTDMTAADHHAAWRVADGSPTAEDLALVRARNLGPVVERWRHVAKLARLDPSIDLSGVVKKDYITRAGLPGAMSEAQRSAEAENRGVAPGASLERSRTSAEIPRWMTEGKVDMGNTADFYGRQIYRARYSEPWYEDFHKKLTGRVSDYVNAKPGTYADANPDSFRILDNLVKQSIGHVQHWEDARGSVALRKVMNNPFTRALGMTPQDALNGTGAYKLIGKLPFVGMRAREFGVYLGDTQKPVSDLFSIPRQAANVLGVGGNLASVARHVVGDTPGLVAKAIRHPFHFAAAALENLPFLKDPQFVEQMRRAGLWDRDMNFRKAFEVVGNKSLARQAVGKVAQYSGALIYATDAMFKGITVKMGERVALERGLAPEPAFQYGVDLARSTQNNFTRANTSPAYAGPIARAFFQFGRAPKRFITQPLAHLMNGEPLEAAAIPAAAAGLYLLGKQAGFNLLPTMIHGRGDTSDGLLESIVPATLLWSDARKVHDLATGEVPWEGLNTEPSALPSSAARRALAAYQSGDVWHDLLGLHEDQGDDNANIDEAIGKTRAGKVYQWWRKRGEENAND